MEIGTKIKSLRIAASMTQEELANKLEISSQAISKWENNVTAPDIYMLPKLSMVFGVTIDEIFDLTVDDKLHRIENMLDFEAVLSEDVFNETKEFLFEQLPIYPKPGRIESFIAHLYHHRMMSDAKVVSHYAREHMRKRPEAKQCQWLLQKAEGAAVCDWNARQHRKTIDFYKELVKDHPDIGRNYLDLMDNLLLDCRIVEARDVLARYRQIADHQERQIPVYEARIALKEGKLEIAEQWIKDLLENFKDDAGALFEAAGYYADRCQYDKALELFEMSYEIDEKPRYSDALQAEAAIYEIKGDYNAAISTLERIIKNYKEEWGFPDCALITETQDEIKRIEAL